jgi:hypothetical protein
VLRDRTLQVNAEVVLDQSVPTFLSAMQSGIFAAQAIPEHISVDNLAAAVLREHFNERGYQREFSAFCKHSRNVSQCRAPSDADGQRCIAPSIR